MIAEAAILGAIQALTEFLPVSSSGHLLLAPAFFGWRDPFLSGLTLSVALHLGTGVALLLALWRQWRWLLRGLAGRDADAPVARRVLGSIVASTVLVAAIGLPLRDAFEGTRILGVVAVMLIVFGVLLALVDRFAPARWTFESTRFAPWLVVGISQLVALIPGVSRSGITITIGRALGIEREAAARYSLLLLTPVVLGVGVLQLGSAAAGGELDGQVAALAVGAAVAAGLGVLVVRGLLWFVARHGLWPFALYRIVLGSVTLALLAAGII
jgi:undecaprenyl-diphosphatase